MTESFSKAPVGWKTVGEPFPRSQEAYMLGNARKSDFGKEARAHPYDEGLFILIIPEKSSIDLLA